MIFRPEGDGTFIAAAPPLVGIVGEVDKPEQWETTAIAAKFHALIFDPALFTPATP